MAIYLAANPLGVFAVSEGKIVWKLLFGKDSLQAAKKLNSWKTLPEVIETIKRFSALTDQPNPASEYLSTHLREIAPEAGFNPGELGLFLSATGAELSKLSITSTERRDKIIVQAVSALNDLDKILNLKTERLREWFGLHYPEFSMRDHEKFVTEIMAKGSREKFDNYHGSHGISFKAEDISTVQLYATALRTDYELRKKLEAYLAVMVKEEMPNTTALLGTLLAARLLAQAGALEKLAKMSSSTIQLLGAEKALFRFMKARGREKVKAPKFGILFTHPDVSGAPRDKQGKIARLLSSKLTIAARADFYSKENKGEALLKEYKEKVAEALRE
ncbi:MAG: hypothetical protein HY362_01670 [Candidatus Aenigmarchaeota archaeon]|nr:hypothetical protein [Candidatus Aenigmarchaeota archaeon]